MKKILCIIIICSTIAGASYCLGILKGFDLFSTEACWISGSKRGELKGVNRDVHCIAWIH